MIHKSLLPLLQCTIQNTPNVGFFKLYILEDNLAKYERVAVGDTVNLGGIFFECIASDSEVVTLQNKYRLWSERTDASISDMLAGLFSATIYDVADVALPRLVDLKKYQPANIGENYWLGDDVLGIPKDLAYIVTPVFGWQPNGVHKAGTIIPTSRFLAGNRGVRPVLIFKELDVPIGRLIDVFGYTWYVFDENRAICDTIIGYSAFSNHENENLVIDVLQNWLHATDKVHFDTERM